MCSYTLKNIFELPIKKDRILVSEILYLLRVCVYIHIIHSTKLKAINKQYQKDLITEHLTPHI